MTIEELENTLPNGFHDAELLSLSRDYVRGTCVLELRVDLESGSIELHRTVKVLLRGLCLMIMEAPDVNYRFCEIGAEETSGFVTTEKYLTELPVLRDKTPAGTFMYSFFLKGLNCCIHIAATDASFL